MAKEKIVVPSILQKNKYGQKEYIDNYQEVVVNGNLTGKEIFCFVSYCVEYGNYMQLEADLVKEGLTCIAGNGTEIPNPKYNMKLASFNAMLKAAMQLNMTPKSRQKKTIAKMHKLDGIRNQAKAK
jgi:P27 family predicted phage terminase small subunit